MADKIYVGDKLISAAYVGDMKVYEEVSPVFTVNITSAHCTYSGISILSKGESGTITIVPEDGYFIRSYDIIVDGADYSFDNINYILTISNPYKNVNVTIECLELYFCFKGNISNFTLTKSFRLTFDGTLQASTDGKTWTNLNSGTTENIDTTTGRVYLRGLNNNYLHGNSTYYNSSTFHSATAKLSICGAVDSLLNYEVVKVNGALSSSYSRRYSYLFTSCSIYDCEDLILSKDLYLNNAEYGELFTYTFFHTTMPKLPAKRLIPSCYRAMFKGCYNLPSFPELPATDLAEYCYSEMFALCNITNSPNLQATNLAPNCYDKMFDACKYLINAPTLPATTLASQCYKYMFSRCDRLTTPPLLSATTLASQCYMGMFSECISLTTAPALPATTLASECYSNMFINCTSLVNAPALPATSLASKCYKYMFSGCTSLVNAPALPAETMENECYSAMFNKCTSLVSTPTLASTTLAPYCYAGMFLGCTSLTTISQLQATVLAEYCYHKMFSGCTELRSLSLLSATELKANCYNEMFSDCSNISLSTEKVSDQQVAYRIPTSGTGTTATRAMTMMFSSTGGTFTGTPQINTTYYTSNTIV